jgi:hypothetical protein
MVRGPGHKLVRINLSEQTDMMDLLGADLPAEGGAAGAFAWSDGPLLAALRAGNWVLLDELNLAGALPLLHESCMGMQMLIGMAPPYFANLQNSCTNADVISFQLMSNRLDGNKHFIVVAARWMVLQFSHEVGFAVW